MIWGNTACQNTRRTIRAEIHRRLGNAPINFLNRRVQGKDQEWHVVTHHPDVNGERSRVQRQSGLDQSDRGERLGDPAFWGEQNLPGVGANQQVGPERDQHQGQGHVAVPTRDGADKERQRRSGERCTARLWRRRARGCAT